MNKKYSESPFETYVNSISINNKKNIFIRDDEVFSEEWKKMIDGLPSIDTNESSYTIGDYTDIIAENLKIFKEIFGINLICFSRELLQTLIKAQVYSRATNAIVIEGEPGSGKTMLAHAVHNYRKGGTLREISCQGETEESLRNEIKEFVNSQPAEKPAGLLVKHINYLSSSQFLLLEQILKDFSGLKYVYLTAPLDFTGKVQHYPENIANSLRFFSIKIDPLRNRRYDLFFQIFYYLLCHSDEINFNYTDISSNVLKELKEYTWPGNSLELNFFVQRLIFENTPPYIKSGSIVQSIDKSSNTHLSPLEEGEKKVIINYLQKNSYNKARTSRELGITINTLNAKIEKYEIVIPKGD